MSHVNSKIQLNNTRYESGKVQTCDKCRQEKVVEGGVRINPARWYCAGCWIKKMTGKK